MEKNELYRRIEETENILLSKLNLTNNLTNEELSEFYEKFIPYLKHSRNDVIGGRTVETLSNYIDSFLDFCSLIHLSDKNLIESIKNFPAIIHISNSEDFMLKYLLLGLIENNDNTIRKDKLINKPRDYEISIDRIYSRYMLMRSLNYIPSWNSLVHSSNNEFANIFIKNGYKKSYKVFNSFDEVNDYLGKYKINSEFINYLKGLPVNKDIIGDQKYGK